MLIRAYLLRSSSSCATVWDGKGVRRCREADGLPVEESLEWRIHLPLGGSPPLKTRFLPDTRRTVLRVRWAGSPLQTTSFLSVLLQPHSRIGVCSMRGGEPPGNNTCESVDARISHRNPSSHRLRFCAWCCHQRYTDVPSGGAELR